MLSTFQSDFGNFNLLIPADIQAFVFAPGQEYDDNPCHSTFMSFGLKQQCQAGSAHLSRADINDNSSSYTRVKQGGSPQASVLGPALFYLVYASFREYYLSERNKFSFIC